MTKKKRSANEPDVLTVDVSQKPHLAEEAKAGPHVPVPDLASRAMKYEAFAVYCPANEDRFNQLASDMQAGCWELVAVVPQQRFVAQNGNTGLSNGWMTFWKRAANMPLHKEKPA